MPSNSSPWRSGPSDTALLVEAYRALGATSFNLGELELARAQMEQVLRLYDPQRHRTHIFVYGMDPGVVGLGVLAWAMWHLGYPDRAVAYNDKLLTLAQELSSPTSLLWLVFAATCHQCRREVALTRERAEAAIILSTDQGFPLTLAWGAILRGWALTEQGEGKDGIAQLRQNVNAYRATGAKVWQSYLFALLAESLGKDGQPEEGLKVLDEALALVAHTGERFYEAELHRLQGELTLTSSGSGGQANAQASFEKAIGIAHAQGSKALELRAKNSLGRLWQQQGKNEEAQRMLVEICGGFAEGFDTADLREANTLLAQSC